MDHASPDPERLGHPQDTNTLRKVLSHLAFGRAVYLRPAELYRPSYPDRPAIRLGTVTQPPSACSLSSSMPNSFGPGSWLLVSSPAFYGAYRQWQAPQGPTAPASSDRSSPTTPAP